MSRAVLRAAGPFFLVAGASHAVRPRAYAHMALHPDRYRRGPGGRPTLLAHLPRQGAFVAWVLAAGRRAR
jgi:hypothetical protein